MTFFENMPQRMKTTVVGGTSVLSFPRGLYKELVTVKRSKEKLYEVVADLLKQYNKK